MKNLLASTALVAMSASFALADGHGHSPFAQSAKGKVLYTSDLVGARLYVSESENGDLEERAEWDDVGEIHDIVVGRDGSVQHVLTDIGGFLGIGEKRVAVSMESLKFVSDGDDSTDYFIVMEGNRAVLEDAPEFDRDAQMAAADMDDAGNNEQHIGNAPADGETDLETAAAETQDKLETHAEETAESVENTAENVEEDVAEAKPMTDRPMFTAPAIERDGYEMAKLDSLTTEEVTGARVYDARDEWIGEVNSLILDDSGKITEAVIDVGGFLGIGEKQVALNMQELNIQRGDGDVRIYVDATQEKLEMLPEWDD